MIKVTVSQLNRYIRAVLEEDAKLSGILVRGEISNFSGNSSSGHLYFTLKDSQSGVRSVMFRSSAQLLRFRPENGMAVLVQANVGVYERDGVYQLYVTDIQPDGEGALSVAFAQKKAELERQGLFDPVLKKELPAHPLRIGVVTSRAGAALQDIRSVLERRYPVCTLVLAHAPVQGEGAAQALAQALSDLDMTGGCDVIIIGRGGGSQEDLWCFNEEVLAYGVFACNTPVISAVGHETDYSICDLVADVRAPTPSAAAELAVPSLAGLRQRLAEQRRSLASAGEYRLARWNSRLDHYRTHRALRSPMAYVMKNQEKLDFSRKALYNRKRIFIQEQEHRLASRAGLLDSLSPLRVLERGYTVVYKDKKPVVRAEDLSPGNKLTLRLRDGSARALVESVELERQE